MIPLRFIKKNVQNLAIEIYKYLHGLSPAILSEGFKVNETITYDLRMCNELCQKSKDSIIQYRNYIFLVSRNLSFDTIKYNRSSSLLCF